MNLDIEDFAEAKEIEFKGKTFVFPETRGKIAACWKKGRFYERRMLRHIWGLKIEGVYLDIGTNIGNHCLFFAAMCKSSFVVGFEPYRALRAIATDLLAINGMGHKTMVMPVALADERKLIDLNVRERPLTIQALTADSVAPGKVGLMKIDVEGAEIPVLRGAKRILAEDRPRVFIEVFDNQIEEVRSIMRDAGYVETGKVFNPSPTYEFVPIEIASTIPEEDIDSDADFF